MYFDIVLCYQLLGKINCPVRLLRGPPPLSSLPLLTLAGFLRGQLPKYKRCPGSESTSQPWGPHGDSTYITQWSRIVGGNRGYPTLPVCDYWNCTGVPALGCSWLLELQAALFEGGGSLLPAGLIICAISGWFCFSSRILVISWVNAAGSSTDALASASGLSRTMAISISLHLFGWGPGGRLAFVQGSQLPCFRTGCVPIPLGLSVPRCQLWWDILGCWRPQCEDEGTVR